MLHLRTCTRLAAVAAATVFSLGAPAAVAAIGGGDLGDLLGGADRPGVIDVPLISVRTEGTLAGLDFTWKAGATRKEDVKSTFAVSRTVTTSLKDTDERTDKITRKLALNVGAEFASGVGKLTGKTSADFTRDTTGETKRTFVRDENTSDTRTLDVMRQHTLSESIDIGPFAGYFQSSVFISNATNVGGYVRDLVVSIVEVGDDGARLPLESGYVCANTGAVIPWKLTQSAPASGAAPVPSPATPAGPPEKCRIRVPAYDPARPEIGLPVRFYGFNTVEFAEKLGRRIYLEVQSFQVELGENVEDAINIEDELRRQSIDVTVIEAGGFVRRRFVKPKKEDGTRRSLVEALQMIYEDGVKHAAGPPRIVSLGAQKSDVETLGDPKTYRVAELDLGAWVATSPHDFTLTDPAPPEAKFLVAFLRKRHLLGALDNVVVHDGLYTWFPPMPDDPMTASGVCGVGTEPRLRVLAGDRIRFWVETDREIGRVAVYKGADLPRAPSGQALYANPYVYSNFWEFFKAEEHTAKADPPVRATTREEAMRGLGLGFVRTAPVVPLADLMARPSVRQTIYTGGRIEAEFTVDRDMLPDQIGEACVFIAFPAFQGTTLKTGRKGAYPPLPDPGGTVALAPGSGLPDHLGPWLAAFPYEDRPFGLKSRHRYHFEVLRRGRAIDDPLAVKRDSDPMSFLSAQCRAMVDGHDRGLFTVRGLAKCDPQAPEWGCIHAAYPAQPPSPMGLPGLPKDPPSYWTSADAARRVMMLRDMIAQGCDNVAASRRIFKNCSGGLELSADETCTGLLAR